MTIFSVNISDVKKIILTITFSFHSLSYLYTILRNPGIPENNRFCLNPEAKIGIRRYKTCRFCKTIMNLDKNTHHCYFCCICVEGIFIILFFNN